MPKLPDEGKSQISFQMVNLYLDYLVENRAKDASRTALKWQDAHKFREIENRAISNLRDKWSRIEDRAGLVDVVRNESLIHRMTSARQEGR